MGGCLSDRERRFAAGASSGTDSDCDMYAYRQLVLLERDGASAQISAAYKALVDSIQRSIRRQVSDD